MKRFLVVLTILVLVAGFAFAAVSGSVEARYTFDFSKETADYGIYAKNAKVKFTLTTESVTSAGSNKPYATVTVDLALDGEELTENDGKNSIIPANLTDYVIAKSNGTGFKAVLKLSDFRIVGENWEINFLKAIGVGDYAKSAWEIDNESNSKKALDAKWDFGATKGITVTYEGYKVGLHVDTEKTLPKRTTHVNLRAESKEFAVAEGITVQAAAGLGYSKIGDKVTTDFGFSVKGAYASDAVSASVAADFQNVTDKFDADVAAKVVVAPVTVDAYYATEVTKTPANSIGKTEDYLSVRAIVDIEKIAPAVPMKVTLYGENLINDGRLLGIKEEGKFGKVSEDAQFGIYPSLKDTLIFIPVQGVDTVLWFANATVGYDVVENVDVRVGAGLYDIVVKDEDDKFAIGAYAFNIGADYKHDLFTASADLYLAKEFASEKVDDYTQEVFSSDLLASAKISVSSEKLVENAVLSASLVFNEKGAEGLYEQTRALDEFKDGQVAPAPATNCLTLSCKVSF